MTTNAEAKVPSENGHVDPAELDAITAEAEDLLNLPSLRELDSYIPDGYRRDVVASHFLALWQEMTRARNNEIGNRTLNENEARAWRERRDAAHRSIGNILKDYPNIKALVQEIAAAQVQEIRQQRQKLMNDSEK